MSAQCLHDVPSIRVGKADVDHQRRRRISGELLEELTRASHRRDLEAFLSQTPHDDRTELRVVFDDDDVRVDHRRDSIAAALGRRRLRPGSSSGEHLLTVVSG